MPFQTFQYQPSTQKQMGIPDITSAISRGLTLGYQPALTKAEIFNKMMGPLANIAISPVGQALQPDAQKAIGNMISQMLSGYGGGQFGDMGGETGTTSGSQGKSTITGSQSPQIPAASDQAPVGTPPGYSPLIPQAGGNMRQGVQASVKAPYEQQVRKPGILSFDEKAGFTSPLTEGNVGNVQQSSVGITNSLPLLNKLQELSKDVLSEGSTLRKYGSRLAGGLFKGGVPKGLYENILPSPKFAGKVAEFESTQAKVADVLKSALLPNMNNEQALALIGSIVQSYPGETADVYVNRMQHQINELYDRQQQNSANLRQGLNVNEQPQGIPGSQAVAQQMQTQESVQQAQKSPEKISSGSKMLSKNLELPNFDSNPEIGKKQFQEWYSKQDKMVQDAVRLRLGGK